MEKNVYLTKDTLSRLARHHKAAIERVNQNEPYHDFAVTVINMAIPDYKAAVSEPTFVKNPAHAQVLVDYMLFLYEDCLRRNAVTFNQKDTEFLFKVLIENQLVETNVQNQRAANILVTQALGMVFNNEQWRRPVQDSTLQQFVECWAETPIRPECLESTESAVRLFYGDAIWELYGQDIPDKYVLPTYLWLANLPVRPMFNRTGKLSIVATEPPTDFN